MATNIQNSWIQFAVPDHVPGLNGPVVPLRDCGCGCGCKACAKAPPVPKAPNASRLPIRYGTGEIVLSATDITVGGFGVPWGHTRTFASRLSQTTNVANGNNWQVKEWSYLVRPTSTTVVVMGSANDVLWFDLVGSNYVPRFDVTQTLLFNAAANAYQLLDLDGSITQFDGTSGALQSHADAAGNQVAVVSYTSNDWNFTEVERTYTVGGVTTTESFLYTYQDPTRPYPLLSGVLLRRQVGSGAWSNVSQALYTYYGSGDAHGGLNDLQTVQTQVWQNGAWATTGTTLYRYWLGTSSSSSSASSGSSSSSSSGPVSLPSLLKYVVNPASYANLAAAVGNPLTATDAQVAQYADFYFEYDGSGRVTKEVTQGGTGTYLFSSQQSGNANGYNSWATKVVETLPDGSQNIVYSNYAGQTMLFVFQSGGSQWCDFYLYDNGSADLILHALPSAVSGFDDQYPDLLHNVGGNYQYLNDSTGLIHTYTYHAPTGYLASESIQQGEFGLSILLRQFFYVACCPAPSSSSSPSSSSPSSSSPSSSSGCLGSLPPVYFLAEEILYPDDPTAGSSSSSSSSSSPGPGRQIITTYAYTWYPGTCQVQQRTTTLPVISAAQNGSGIAATRRDYFDIHGNLTWQMDERGFLTNTTYDTVTGAVSQRIDDVDTTQVSGAPPGWTTPAGGGLNLVTDYQFDSLGRTTQVLGPSHTIDVGGVATTIRRATWTVYQDGTFQRWTGMGYATGTAPNYTYTLINPVSITIFDPAWQTLHTIQATRASTSGALQPTDIFPQSSYVRWATTQYANTYFVASQRVYKLIPVSGTGTSGTNYDESDFGYDVIMRQNRVVTPGGTITRTVYDARSNPAQVWVGTNDTGATDNDPSGGGAPGNNMVQVTGNQYDNGLGGGDNNLTMLTQYVDGSTSCVTTLLYDWRDRCTDTDGEVDFYQKVYYDNLNRQIKAERYDMTPSGNLIARALTYFDDRSRVYQTIRYGVDPTTGAVGNGLVDNKWYDAARNLLKVQPAGSQGFNKMVYDGVGRVTTRYSGYNLTDQSYANASSVATDTILEQVETSYDAASNVIQTATRLRYHNATGVGVLGSPSSAQPQARVTYVALYPDALGRNQATADYGTNGGTSLVRSSTIPARSDTVLVSSTQYDNTGAVQTTTDPAGTVTCFSYDAVGREVQRVLNCLTPSSSSSPSRSSGSSGSSVGCPPSTDSNVTILTAYNADGNVSSITAVNAATGNQVTQYVYGSTLAASGVASSLLKVADVYPDSVGGSDQVSFTYNRQGEVTSLTDQNGTVHSYLYDLLGRLTQDCITTLGSGVDGVILRIATGYEVRGIVSDVTSYDNATVGSGNVVNDVQLAYNTFAQLVTEYQSHAGAVNTATTPNVQYTYANGSANTIRPTAMIYPNVRNLTYDYGTAGGINDAASRIGTLFDNDGVTHLGDYSYLGRAGIVVVTSAQPQIQYTLVGIAGGNDPVTGDIYWGLDLFGRVKDLIWTAGGGSSSSGSSSSGSSGTETILERVQHGYGRAGNRIYRADPVDPNDQHDEFYLYDGLERLKDLTRGGLNAGKTGIATPAFAQCWGLDATGNLSNFQQDNTGSGTWNLIQSRTANPVNEITGIATTGGSAWVVPAYNPAGNMTTMPQPGSPSSSYSATYDAWNRLMSLSVGGNLVAQYQYDGLRRRTIKKRYAGGVLTETRHFYYSQAWQVVEERIDPSTNANRQFVWGLRYLDDLLLRDRDTTGTGTVNERFYALQDPNWNVTALADITGTVQERYAYDAYGVPAVLTPSFGARGSSLYDWETRYTGYRWDSDSQLYQVRSRSYQPLLGCWAQRDPIGGDESGVGKYFLDLVPGIAGGTAPGVGVRLAYDMPHMNLYGYARNVPTGFADPFGTLPWPAAPVACGCWYASGSPLGGGQGQRRL